MGTRKIRVFSNEYEIYKKGTFPSMAYSHATTTQGNIYPRAVMKLSLEGDCRVNPVGMMFTTHAIAEDETKMS